MFYIFAEGSTMFDESNGNFIFVATCVDPIIAHEFRQSGYCVSRCIDVTKASLAISHPLRLVKG